MNSGTITNTGDVTLGALGSTAQEYALTLNVTGSKSVTTGAINTKDQAITVNANSLTGKADIGAINAITGNVAIDVDTTGAVDVHAITGKDISLDLSGALGAVSYAGAITATGNVTTVGSNLKANDLDTNDIVLAGTSQTVSVIGSILNDDVDVTSGSDSTSITVSGDLSVGTDSLDVVATTATGKDTTINVSGVTGAETVNITGSDGKNTITGTAGVDTITGAEGLDTIAGGAGQDNFVIASSADAGAGEKYTDFVAGAAGDVFNFTKATIVNGAATTSDGATALAVDTTGGGTTDTDNTDVLLFTGASYADTTALLAAANGANGVGEGSDGDLDGNSVIAVFHDDTGTDAGTYVAYLTGAADHSADGFASATIIAQLSSLDELSDIADITADNFTIA